MNKIKFIDERSPLTGTDKVKFDTILRAFKEDGFTIIANDEGERSTRLKINDVLMTPDFARFIPKVIHTIVREAQEPRMVITQNLFQKVNLETGRSIQIGAIGAMHASIIPEGGVWPTASLSLDDTGEMIQPVMVQKHGLMLPVTHEVLEEDQWGVLNIWLRAAGRALARHKEQEAMKLLNEMGYTLFDNANPDNAEYGSTSGRDINGAQNGAMTFNDMIQMYGYLLMRGFVPDTIVMHPLAWMVFATDPLMRELVMKNGTVASQPLPNGEPTPSWGSSLQGFGPRYTATGTGPGNGPDDIYGKFGASAYTTSLNPLGATFYAKPDYLPVPIKVLVTPFAYFKQNAGLAGTPAAGAAASHVILADSSATGVLVQKSPIRTEEFDDPKRDIRNLKIGEIYGFAILEQGKGVTVARNVVLTKHYNFDNVNSVTLAPISGVTLVS